VVSRGLHILHFWDLVLALHDHSQRSRYPASVIRPARSASLPLTTTATAARFLFFILRARHFDFAVARLCQPSPAFAFAFAFVARLDILTSSSRRRHHRRQDPLVHSRARLDILMSPAFAFALQTVVPRTNYFFKMCARNTRHTV
jgi:hypothetical protein